MAAVQQHVVQFSSGIGADRKLRELSANETVFAVVGPIGSGTSAVATALARLLSNEKYGMDVHVVKASEAISRWSERKNGTTIDESSTFNKVAALQDAGDAMRRADLAAVGIELISAIKQKRASLTNDIEDIVTSIKAPALPRRRAYILDSLKHPAEVALLRAIYQDSFCLIGVVCEEEIRTARLVGKKCTNTGTIDIQNMMKRDEDAHENYGQKVTDTFHLADYFVDNSPPRFTDEAKQTANHLWIVNDQLARLVDLITVAKVIRPSSSETGMFHAYGAKMRSACLSRQVGAALMDKKGNLLSTGTNEVPRAGGGVYGEGFANGDDEEIIGDDRCVISNKYCSSNQSQDTIINEIIDAIPQLKEVVDKIGLAKQLKRTPIGKLLEFSRAVHAEMDALLSAARTAASTVGTRLFVTTYPCHYCARHLVAAGVDEVQFIEPYPKSRALKLHGDAITNSPESWIAPSALVSASEVKSRKQRKVLFRPFTGVAPRLYRQVFLKDRKLKNDLGVFEIGSADSASGLLRLSYQEVEEAVLADRGAES